MSRWPFYHCCEVCQNEIEDGAEFEQFKEDGSEYDAHPECVPVSLKEIA